jgi:uncharacterized surface protein with fasciclin (FAS1) repeats
MTLRPFALTLAAASAVALAACGGNNAETETAATDAAPATDMAAPAAGGATIAQAAAATPDLSTLNTAVGAAGLGETLSGPGPFTVFAPNNAAFAKLPAGTVENLTQPAQKDQLTTILTYHVVPGNVNAAALTEQITAGGGKAELTTVQGGKLTASLEGGAPVLTDAKGGKARVIQPDVAASNGVVHVIDTVVMPQ